MLTGVMYFVDKWLEGNELEQDEVNRAITMREKTLRIIENAKTDVAREIFEEIEKYLISSDVLPDCCRLADMNKIAELKKKYTEDKT